MECLGLIIFDCDGTLVDPQTRQAYPKVPGLLRQLVAEGFCLVLWTGRERVSSFKLLKELDMMSYFWEFFCGDDASPKPNPEGVRELISEFDTIVMIGDGPVDKLAAKHIGARFIWAGWNPDVNALTKTGGVDPICKNPEEILEIVFDYLRSK